MTKYFSFSSFTKSSLCITMILFCLFLPKFAVADTRLSDFFVNGIVTHGDNGIVTFGYNTQLTNGLDSSLHATSISKNNGSSIKTCDSTDCTVGYAPKSALDLPDFSISGDDYTIGYQDTQTLSPGAYGTIKTNQSILTFDSGNKGSDAIYKINTLALSYNDKVTFGPGYYWIENFSMNDTTYDSFDLDDNEQVVLAIKNNTTISDSLNEGGDASQLIIISYGDLQVKSKKTVNGFIYAGGTLSLNSPSYVNGAIAGEAITLNSESKVTFIDTAPTINLEPSTDTSQGCSDYIGDATINEVSKNKKNKDSDDDFVELKMLNTAISRDIYKNWSIQICEDGSSSCSTVSLSDSEFDFTTYPWLVAKGSANVGSYIDINDGTEIILFDASGYQIDYLSIGGYSPNPSSCTFAYDTDVVTGASPFRVMRSPDGTGDWDAPSGNSTKATEGANNDGEKAIPSPIVNYHFDESSWDGTTDEVTDSSTTNLDGTAKGDATTIADGKVCRAATFDGDGDYINVSDIDDYLSTTASLSFWTKSNQTGSNTAWDAPGITGIEEYGGGDDIFWGYIDNNNHIQIKKGNGNSVGSTTNINDGQWHHVVLTRDSSTGTVQVFVNGLLENSNTSTTGDIGNSFSSIGRIEDTRTTTSSDYSQYFSGQIDELLVFDSVLSSDHVETIYVNQLAGRDYNQNEGTPRTCPTVDEEIDHYEIIHDGSGLTCESEEVTIKACTDDDCTTTSTEAVTLDLYGNGSKLTSVDSFTGSTTVSFSHTTIGTLTLSIKDETEVCTDGNEVTSCDIIFADAGFIFSQTSAANSNIKNQVAGTSFTVYLRAVEDVDGVCTGVFNDDKTISLSLQNIEPNNYNVLNLTLFDSNGDTKTLNKYDSYSDIDLEFNNASEATLQATYSDAGQIKLHAKYRDDDISLTGNSNSFWVIPSYLEVTAQSNGSDINGSNSSSTIKHKAGQDFTLNVSAYNSKGVITSNYSPGNMQFKLTRTAPTESYNVNGTLTYADDRTTNSRIFDNASFTNVTLTTDDFDDGEFSYTAAKYSEVGLLTLDAQDTDYANCDGDKECIIGSSGPINIGRFTPDHFEITATTNGALSTNNGYAFFYTGQMSSATSTEGAITYSTQPDFTLTAKSAADADGNSTTTQNYTGNFMKLDADSVTLVEPTTDASQDGADETNKVNLSANLKPLTIDELTGTGVIKYTFSDTDNFVYTREKNSLIAPFPAAIELQITSIIDNDGIRTNYYNGDNGIVTLEPTGVEVRFGRWYIENSYGPETSKLRIPMQVQYWDGSAFITNDSDSFTTFDSEDATLTYGSLTTTTTAAGSGTFSAGETKVLTLTAPGSGNQGDLTLSINVPQWLQYDWSNTDSNSDGPYTEDPSAEVTFGLYRGNDRVIYRGEVFE